MHQLDPSLQIYITMVQPCCFQFYKEVGLAYHSNTVLYAFGFWIFLLIANEYTQKQHT